MMQHILIVEDDVVLAEGLCRALSSGSIKARCCGRIGEARAALGEDSFSLVLLDVNLPDGNGFLFLHEIKESCEIPVIMLTANDMETDIVAGLEQGADDYITKPFSLAVLRARVQASLRRCAEKNHGQKFRADHYDFDFERMEFFCSGKKVELSKTEQKLLWLLVENAGVTISRAGLVDRIWTDGAEYVDENALSVTVKRLRDKLNAQAYIRTVYGIGYVWGKKDE